jgi:L-amino acid N-acyltransferase YncA
LELSQQLSLKAFSDINLQDPFFDSLKSDYAEFEAWFRKKHSNSAYVFLDGTGLIDGFLYLKQEHERLDDVVPPQPEARRIKVGTFKINPHGTRLGERFLKKVFDNALDHRVDEIYVTAFPKHSALVELFLRYGFIKVATKTTSNGTEDVLMRCLRVFKDDVVLDYPAIPIVKDRHFAISLYPQWHTRLLPDSLLQSENVSIVRDVSHTNSIHKIYLTAMQGVEQLERGDTLLIYRTNDFKGPAHYRSVITSVCVVEELRNINDFPTLDDFLRYTRPYSVFSEQELQRFYQTRKYPWLIRFTYNLALRKRVTRGELIEKVGLRSDIYWGFFPISSKQFASILKLAGDYESALINKTGIR